MSRFQLSRRDLIAAGTASLGGLMLTGCDRLNSAPTMQKLLGTGQTLSFNSQRLLLSGQPLAREYPISALSPVFKANGTLQPESDEYQTLADAGFVNWHLAVDGQVERSLNLSLADLQAMPARTQITRHDCVEGWSAIGQWTGVNLSHVLALAGVRKTARYVVLHCADNLDQMSGDGGLYYESIDLFDAFHPQTILAWAMNGKPLTVAHGAPLRLRVERQLGYKQAKYVMRLELTDRLDKTHGGKGGFWEDRGYEWYAGI